MNFRKTVARVKVGDIIELKTGSGLGYAQVTHVHPQYGHLLRVLEGLHMHRPNDFAAIADRAHRFVAFFPANAAAKRGIITVVATERIPDAFRDFPYSEPVQ